jgi:hypothetical protein
LVLVKVGSIDDPVWSSPNDDAASAEERRKSQRRSILVLGLVVLVSIAILYPAAAAVLSRKDYGTFAFWKVPNRIDYCGRRYYDGGIVLGSPGQFQSQYANNGAHWTFLSWTFSGRSIDAVVVPGGGHQEIPCAGTLYIPLGEGRWEVYSLSGGP